MSRLVLLAISVVALSMPAAALAAERPNPSDLEAELVCPICESTLDQSDAPVARRMKAFIRAQIAAGWTEQQIKDALVAEFGEGVLAEPPKRGFDILAWALPLTALIGGAVLVGVLAVGWSRRAADDADAEQPLDAEVERRIDDELSRYEP